MAYTVRFTGSEVTDRKSVESKLESLLPQLRPFYGGQKIRIGNDEAIFYKYGVKDHKREPGDCTHSERDFPVRRGLLFRNRIYIRKEDGAVYTCDIPTDEERLTKYLHSQRGADFVELTFPAPESPPRDWTRTEI